MKFIRKITHEEIADSKIFLQDETGKIYFDNSFNNCEMEILCNSKAYNGGIKNAKIPFIKISTHYTRGNVNNSESDKKHNDIYTENNIVIGDLVEVGIPETINASKNTFTLKPLNS